MRKIKSETKRELPKYTYPDHVLTAAMLQKYAHYGIELAVKRKDCTQIAKLDSQCQMGKAIFGGGLLLSEKAAAEKAAAEKAAAEKAAAEKAAAHIWELSERERQIVASLGK